MIINVNNNKNIIVNRYISNIINTFHDNIVNLFNDIFSYDKYSDEELKNFIQVCPKEMLAKLSHPLSNKIKISKAN